MLKKESQPCTNLSTTKGKKGCRKGNARLVTPDHQKGEEGEKTLSDSEPLEVKRAKKKKERWARSYKGNQEERGSQSSMTEGEGMKIPLHAATRKIKRSVGKGTKKGKWVCYWTAA